MDTFQNTVVCELHKLQSSMKITSKSLRANDNIIIRSADKGGCTVVLDKGLYIKQINEMLLDRNTYRPLKLDPTKDVQLALEHVLNEGIALGVINGKIKEHLTNTIPVFHALPKTHKGIFPPPSRPIVAGIGSVVENTCIWLDNLLQPLVQRVPGYIKNSKELLKAFDDMWRDDNYKWVTSNVTALYTCIPHNKALIALSFHLRKYSNYSCEFREFTFLLSHNFFLLLMELFIYKFAVARWVLAFPHRWQTCI